ncbi:hypothetical protein VPH35_122385 [Triticum aestivum]
MGLTDLLNHPRQVFKRGPTYVHGLSRRHGELTSSSSGAFPFLSQDQFPCQRLHVSTHNHPTTSLAGVFLRPNSEPHMDHVHDEFGIELLLGRHWERQYWHAHGDALQHRVPSAVGEKSFH